MEKVDILKPPTFEKSGETKPLQQAWRDEGWIGTFNFWIAQTQRSKDARDRTRFFGFEVKEEKLETVHNRLTVDSQSTFPGQDCSL